jgi:hypothetical protein
VPNEVLTKENYDIIVDSNQSTETRLAAFANRAAWIAPLGTGYTKQINKMIHHFDHLGVVEVNPGPADPVGKALFPPVIEVEDQHVPIEDPASAPSKPAAAAHAALMRPSVAIPAAAEGQLDLSAIDKVRRFPHGLLKR